jgi:single-stranded DNA-binding protein
VNDILSFWSVSPVDLFRPRLAESVLNHMRKGAHVLVDGQFVSSEHQRENDKSKKAKAASITDFSNVRANSVRRLSRTEANARNTSGSRSSSGRNSDLRRSCEGSPAAAEGPFSFVLNYCQIKQSSTAARQIVEHRHPRLHR